MRVRAKLKTHKNKNNGLKEYGVVIEVEGAPKSLSTYEGRSLKPNSYTGSHEYNGVFRSTLFIPEGETNFKLESPWFVPSKRLAENAMTNGVASLGIWKKGADS